MRSFTSLHRSAVLHLFKLVWNRRRSNLLIIIELVAAFLVLFAVCLAVIHFTRVHRQSLGYEYKNVWRILVSRKESDDAKETAAQRLQTVKSIAATLHGLPQVASVSYASNTPFSFAQNTTSFNRGKQYQTELLTVDDNFNTAMNMTLTQGRWFNASDDAYNGTTSTVKSVIINEHAAQVFFGKENPVGQDIRYNSGKGVGAKTAAMRYRVVGVVNDFRRGSEFDQTGNFMFQRFSQNDTTVWIPNNIILKMNPGVTAAYEETMLKHLGEVAPTRTFQISSLETDRTKKHEMFFVPFGVGLTVGAFMLLTVSLGLVGVVWQSVTRRMRELGVRRAFGATRQDIMVFVIGELLALTTFSVLFGLFVIAQVPLLPFYDVPESTYFLSISAAVGGMYMITTLCALYPSRLAGTVQPSEALRYE